LPHLTSATGKLVRARACLRRVPIPDRVHRYIDLSQLITDIIISLYNLREPRESIYHTNTNVGAALVC
jgi:hypothetical protein